MAYAPSVKFPLKISGPGNFLTHRKSLQQSSRPFPTLKKYANFPITNTVYINNVQTL